MAIVVRGVRWGDGVGHGEESFGRAAALAGRDVGVPRDDGEAGGR
jgi:hypothetical protein